MPYVVVRRTGSRPWKILRKDTRRVVGSSTSRAKALRSIGYRMAAEPKTWKKKKKKTGT